MNGLLILLALIPFSSQEVISTIRINTDYPKIVDVDLQKGDSIEIFFSFAKSFIVIIGDPKFYLSVYLTSTSKNYYSTKPGLYAIGNDGTAKYTALETGSHKIVACAISTQYIQRVVALGCHNHDPDEDINPSWFAFIETDPNEKMNIESNTLNPGAFVRAYKGESYTEYKSNHGKFSADVERLVTVLSNDRNSVDVTIKSNGNKKFDYGKYNSNKFEVNDIPFYYISQDVKENMVEGIYDPSEDSSDGINSKLSDSEFETDLLESESDSDSNLESLKSDSELSESELSESESSESESSESESSESESSESESSESESSKSTEEFSYSETYSATESSKSESESSKDESESSKDESESSKNNSNDDSDSSSHTKLSKGAICGITIGCIVAVSAATVIIIFVVRRNKNDSIDLIYDNEDDVKRPPGGNNRSALEMNSDDDNDLDKHAVNRRQDKNTKKNPINSNIENFEENPQKDDASHSINRRQDKNSKKNPINSNVENFEENPQKDDASHSNNRRQDKNSRKNPIDANIENVSGNSSSIEDIGDSIPTRHNFGNNRRQDKNSRKNPIDANIENVSGNSSSIEEIGDSIPIRHNFGNQNNDVSEPGDIEDDNFDDENFVQDISRNDYA